MGAQARQSRVWDQVVRWGRLLGFAVAAVGLIAGGLVLKEQLWRIPRTVRRTAVDWFLQALLVTHGLLVMAAPLGTIVLTVLILRARTRGARRPRLARGLLLSISCLFGLGLMEGSAAAWQAWTHRIPVLPEKFAKNASKPDAEALPDLPVDFKPEPARPSDEVEIVVMGESSAKGEPYGDPMPPQKPWLSVGQILGWQLGRAIPGRTFHTTILAIAGNTLERQHKELAEIERRPDVLIVYAGHNEFQARFNWERIVAPEAPAQDTPSWIARIQARTTTPLGRMIREAQAGNGVEVAPPSRITRRLVDWPVCTPEEHRELRTKFAARLDAIVAYCERIKTLPVLIIPPGNDAGYEPNRSVALGRLSKDDVDALTREFKTARTTEDTDPARALALYRAFLTRQPDFAEAHYRIARLLEHTGDYAGANREFILARDLDGFPQRFPSDFEDVYRDVAARHPSAILVEGPTVLRAISRHGILDDNLFHDAQHPVLLGHIALAQAVLDALRDRKALGWPSSPAALRIDPAECADHFGMNANRWAVVCSRVVFFYGRTAYLRHDPKHRLAIVEAYENAARAIEAGRAPEETGVPGLGVKPSWKD